jgi:hypothetical protein
MIFIKTTSKYLILLVAFCLLLHGIRANLVTGLTASQQNTWTSGMSDAYQGNDGSVNGLDLTL